MPIPVLLILIIICVVTMAFLIAENQTKQGIIAGLCLFCLVTWGGFAIAQPWTIKEVIETKSYKIEDTDVVSYKLNDEVILVNLNKQLGKSVPPGTGVTVTIFNDYYYGLVFNEKQKVSYAITGAR